MSGLKLQLPAILRFKRSHCFLIGLVSVLVTGCATTPTEEPLRERLDRNSGATVTTLNEPIAFYRDQPMLAANARDYVYVGPVEVNQSGHRHYLLWANYCSTIDRIRRIGFWAPESTYLMLDGEPMELARVDRPVVLADWLYDSPVAGGETVVYQVTRGQLLAIARAREILIVAEGSGNLAAEFESWRESKSDFRRFSRYLGGDSTSQVALAYGQ